MISKLRQFTLVNIAVVCCIGLTFISVNALAQEALTDYASAPEQASQAVRALPEQAAPPGVTFYTDRPTFEAAFPDLDKEDFEDTNVAGGAQGCDGPADSSSSQAGCWDPGDIEPGLSFDSVAPRGPGGAGLALIGPGFSGNLSKNLVANFFVDAFSIDFTDLDDTVAGFELHCYFSTDVVNVDVYGTGGLIASAPANCTSAGAFFGVDAGEVIARIEIFSPAGQAEGVDNVCFGEGRQPGVIKELISGPLDQNGDIALAVEVGQLPPPVMYDFTIDYYNPGGPDVLIQDTVPAEWDTIADVVNALNCSLAGANKKNNGKSATKIDCEYSGDGAVTAFWNTARCHDNKKNKKCRPTSCGALYLNDGAEVFEVDEFGDPLLDEDGNLLPPIFTSNNLCLVAVADGDDADDGIDLTGEGDEDGDGFLDWDEACFWGNDPCDFTPDTDEDGVPDPNDNCVDTPNSDQSDVDEDGLGDVCDPCPNDPDQSCICEEAFDCGAGNLNECQAGGVCACFPNVNGPNVCVDATTGCSGLTACPVGDECGPNQACLPDTCCGIQVCVNTNECSGSAPVNYSSDQGPTIGMQ